MNQTEKGDQTQPPIVLRFRADGDAYGRAKAVAEALGLSMEEYLFQCVWEGHRVLQSRQVASGMLVDERETIPAFVRREGLMELE